MPQIKPGPRPDHLGGPPPSSLKTHKGTPSTKRSLEMPIQIINPPRSRSPWQQRFSKTQAVALQNGMQAVAEKLGVALVNVEQDRSKPMPGQIAFVVTFQF
jgi:hypothetical protein